MISFKGCLIYSFIFISLLLFWTALESGQNREHDSAFMDYEIHNIEEKVNNLSMDFKDFHKDDAKQAQEIAMMTHDFGILKWFVIAVLGGVFYQVGERLHFKYVKDHQNKGEKES